MMNRRHFLAGCCALHTLPLLAQTQPADGSQFICSAIVPPDHMSVITHSSETEKMEIEESAKTFDLSPHGTIAVGDRWRRNEGSTPGTGKITLGVFFMGGTADAQKRVIDNARVWQDKTGGGITFDFNVEQDRSHLRVSFDGNDGNWSIIGRASANQKISRPTMNLSDVIPNIIQHEFGHAIGLQHEHSHPGGEFRWNEDVVINAMKAYGWSAATTRRNIFERYGNNYACLNKPKPDYDSVMFYPIPLGWAVIRKTTTDPWVPFTHPGGKLISAEDVACIKGVYGLRA